MKKITILWLITLYASTFYAQQGLSLFEAEEEGCAPLNPIHPNSVINNALSYKWDFGNGKTSYLKYPNISLDSAGEFTPTLTITISATDYIINELNIESVSNAWNDDGDGDKDPDFYFDVKNNRGEVIFKSNVMADRKPSVRFRTPFILTGNETYTIEIWEFDAQTPNDFIEKIPITANSEKGNLTVGNTTISFRALTGETEYESHGEVVVAESAKVKITQAGAFLVATPSRVVEEPVFIWTHNGIVLENETLSSMKSRGEGIYTVTLQEEGAGCSASDTLKIVALVATVTNIKELENSIQLKISPNPVPRGNPIVFNFNSIKNQKGTLVLTDLFGRVIESRPITLAIGENQFTLAPPQLSGIFTAYLKIETYILKNYKIVVY